MEIAVSGGKLYAIALFHKVAYTKKFKEKLFGKVNFFYFFTVFSTW